MVFFCYRKQTAILASKEAQVLTIRYDDNHTITDSDSSETDTEVNEPYPVPQLPHEARPSLSKLTSSRGVITTSSLETHSNVSTTGHDESYEVTTSPNKPEDTLQQSLSMKLSMWDAHLPKHQNTIVDSSTCTNGLRSGKIR